MIFTLPKIKLKLNYRIMIYEDDWFLSDQIQEGPDLVDSLNIIKACVLVCRLDLPLASF